MEAVEGALEASALVWGTSEEAGGAGGDARAASRGLAASLLSPLVRLLTAHIHDSCCIDSWVPTPAQLLFVQLEMANVTLCAHVSHSSAAQVWLPSLRASPYSLPVQRRMLAVAPRFVLVRGQPASQALHLADCHLVLIAACHTIIEKGRCPLLPQGCAGAAAVAPADLDAAAAALVRAACQESAAAAAGGAAAGGSPTLGPTGAGVLISGVRSFQKTVLAAKPSGNHRATL